MSGIDKDTLEDLLLDRAVGELSAGDEPRLDSLLEAAPDVDGDEYDRVAGELIAALATAGGERALPSDVASTIVDAGRRIVVEEHRSPLRLMKDEPEQPTSKLTLDAGPTGERKARWREWAGWAAAAAVAAWLLVPGSDGPSLQELRAEVLQESSAVQVAWTATEDPAARSAQGEVVWSTETQRGVMRFSGLEANDPSATQYQLWIFDATRDERFPVDGGVFDVPPGGGDVLVEIRPTVAVRDPSLFAVTVERPGGVVVSDRERIVVLAQLSD